MRRLIPLILFICLSANIFGGFNFASFRYDSNFYSLPTFTLTSVTEPSKRLLFEPSITYGAQYSSSRFTNLTTELLIDLISANFGFLFTSDNFQHTNDIALYTTTGVGYATFEIDDPDFSFLPNHFLTWDIGVGILIKSDIIMQLMFPKSHLSLGLDLGAKFSILQSSIVHPFTFYIGGTVVF